tara:strand:- start:5700 stop:6461 length:762 start_codon:yes stop_codon:yes gene_type:complete
MVFFTNCGAGRRINVKKNSALKTTYKNQKTTTFSKKNINSSLTSKSNRAIEYIKKYSSIAKEEMKKFKIPASITLAQGILESGSGYGSLALRANNHFGIKCHKGWKGKRIYHDDDKKGECFRVYKNPKRSFRDHSRFLTDRDRYKFLFEYKITNYKAWAKGLKKAGYATDPKYPKKLIEIIERYELYRFDKKRFSKKKDNKSKRVIYYKVEKGDTLYSISKKYNISVKEILNNNKLNNNIILLGQILEIPINK